MNALRFIVVAGLSVAASSVLSQSHEARAAAGARELLAAMKQQNAAAVAKWIPPEAKRAAGGEAKVIEILAMQYKRAKEAKLEIERAELGVPSPVTKAGEAHITFIPYTLVAVTPERKVTDKAFYLAISYDGGKEWYYVDGIRMSPQSLRSLVPGYTGKPAMPISDRRVE